MSKFCIKCGKPLIEGADFCMECGAKAHVTTSDKNKKQDQTKESYYQSTTKSPPIKSNILQKKLFMGIITIVVCLIIIMAGFFMLFGSPNNSNDSKSEESKFYGIWETQSAIYDGTPMSFTEWTMELKSDGTYIENNDDDIETGTWSIKDGKYCETGPSGIEQSGDYSFSNGDSTLTLTFTAEDEQGVIHTAIITATKKSNSNNNVIITDNKVLLNVNFIIKNPYIAEVEVTQPLITTCKHKGIDDLILDYWDTKDNDWAKYRSANVSIELTKGEKNCVTLEFTAATKTDYDLISLIKPTWLECEIPDYVDNYSGTKYSGMLINPHDEYIYLEINEDLYNEDPEINNLIIVYESDP